MYNTPTRTQFYAKERQQNKCVVKRRVVAEDDDEVVEATQYKSVEPKRVQYYTTMSQMKPNAVTKKRPPLVEENDVNVDEETENGCIYERREFRDNIEEEGNRPCTLFECVSNGVLHMDQAARMVWKKKKDGTFNRAVYEEFIRSDVAARARPTFDELDQDNDEDWWRYNFLALRLLSEINRSTNQRIARNLDFKENQSHVPAAGTVTVDINNACNVWRIEASPPFLDVRLGSTAGKWNPRKRDGTFQKISHLYRFLLTQVTAPPSEIQRYSMRINRRAGRCEALQNLPEQVEDTFIGFGVDVLGFGRRELEEGATNLQDSTFYMGLGATESERREALSKLQRQKAEWRSYMYTALQKALRDIRSYTFSQCTGWTPSPKQARKTGEGCTRSVMDGDNNLVNSD